MPILSRPSQTDLHRARNLVMRHGWNTMAYQILNPGIALWFPYQREAVIGCVETRTHVIVAGSPVAPEEELDDVVLEFYRYVSSHTKKVCFFGAQERIALILSKRAPVSSILLGAQPVWSPGRFVATMQTKQSLRAQVHRAANKGVTIQVINSGIRRNDNALLAADLHRILSEWITSRRLPPMHFLVEPDTLGNLEDRIVAVARIEDTAVGFCIASPIPLRLGWLIEQIVRGNQAPNGTAELLLETMVSHLQSIGAKLVTLGLSPLSRHYAASFSHPFWLKTALHFTRLYGKYFYNFEGLDAFKAKFLPSEWEPVYAITNEKNPSPSTIYAIATAFSGISPARFVMKGVMRMMES